jgi:hypothetical protein
MDSFARQAIILALLDALKDQGSWCGETHVQKSAYFLQDGLGVPTDLEFLLYKHGPFSFELRDVLGEMRGNFLIDVESRSPYGSSLVVAEPGRRLMNGFPKTTARYEPQVAFVAGNLASRDVVALERLGTALYVQKQFPDLDARQQARRITELKPHIKPEVAEDASDEVRKLLAQAPLAGSV